MVTRFYLSWLLSILLVETVVSSDIPRETVQELKRQRIAAKVLDDGGIHVDLRKRRDAAKLLSELAKIESIKELDLSQLAITDEDVKQLAEFTNLTAISLADTAVTDDGMQHLAAHKKLKWLDLSGTKVSNAGVAKLTVLAGLQSLGLARTRLTDEALEGVEKLSALRELNLSFTASGNKLIESLAELKTLESLNLSATKCTDAGLRPVGKLPELHSLWLDGTAVRDVGLEHLIGAKKLKNLSANKSGIADFGLMFNRQWRLGGRLPLFPVDDGDWYTWEMYGWLEMVGKREVIVFSATPHEAQQEVELGKIMLYTVFNTRDFCVMLQDDPIPRHPGAAIRVKSEASSYWRNSPPPILRLVGGEKHTAESFEFRHPLEGGVVGGKKRRPHTFRVKRDGSEVVIDGQPFDLTYGKRYFVIDERGKIREVEIR